MSPTVACPGCGAALPAPAHLVGQIVQCARCARQFALPRPVLDAVAVAPATPPPRSRRDNDEDDDRPTRRAPKRKPKGVPVWVWAVLASGLVLLVGGGGLLAYFFLSPGTTDGTRLSDGWVKMTPAGTTVSWEFPTKPELDAKGQGGALPKAGENLYGCVLKQSGKQSVIFLVTITHHEGHDKLFPGQTLDDFAKAAQPGGGTVFGRHLRKYDLQGRTANLFVQEVTEKVILIVTEPGKTYRFEAFGPDVDPTNATVKRFLDSVSFTLSATPAIGAGPAKHGREIAPAVVPVRWERVSPADAAVSWEYPGRHFPNEEHPTAGVWGTRSYCNLLRADGTTAVFSVRYAFEEESRRLFPGFGAVEHIRSTKTGDLCHVGVANKRWDIQARPAVYGRFPGSATLTMLVAEPGLTVQLQVFVDKGKAEEHDPDVQRFFNSVKFSR